MDGSSIVFLLAEDLKNLEEQTDDISVEDDRPQHIIIKCQFFVLSTKDHLGVDHQIDTVYDRKQESHAHHQQVAPYEQQIDKGDGDCSPTDRVNQP